MAINPEDRPVPEIPVQEDELQRLKELAAKHGLSIGIAVLAVLVVVVGANFHEARKQSALRRAEIALSEAVTVDDFSNIVKDYASTPTAPIAMLKLAKKQYNNGGYAMAIETYEKFATRYPAHELAAAATLGVLHCMEATARFEEALDGYRAFATEHPGHFLTPQAVLGEARCLDLLGRTEDAKAVYEDFLTADSESEWAPRAEERLAEMKKRLARAAMPPVPALTVPALTTAPTAESTSTQPAAMAPEATPVAIEPAAPAPIPEP